MKISEKIKEIIADAEAQYGYSMHLNDGISVGTYFNNIEWQVWLERPTKDQLERGEIVDIKLDTIKRWDTEVALYTTESELHVALNRLHERVLDGEDWQ